MDKLDRIEQELNKQGVVLGKLEVNMDNIKDNLQKHLEVEQCDSCRNNARLTVLEKSLDIYVKLAQLYFKTTLAIASTLIVGGVAFNFKIILMWITKFFA